MKRALVLIHLDHDDPGRFMEIFHANDITYDTINLLQGEMIPDDAASRYDLLMPLGGAMQVWQEDEYPWLRSEKEFIRDWVSTRAKPFIGICLGPPRNPARRRRVMPVA